MRRVALLFIAGCGRIAFDPTPAGGSSDGGEATDGGGSDGPAVAPNRVFITKGTHDGTIGGLAAADGMCAAEATIAGLSGTFVAFASTSSVNAVDRIAGSRGWVRTDGEPVLDLPADLTALRVLNPIVLDAGGQPVTSFIVWTGSDSTGRTSTNGTCNDWTSAAPSGATGDASYGQPILIGVGGASCNTPAHFYCFEVGRSAVVGPRVVSGRLAFHSVGGRSGTGVAALDTLCQTEASGSSLPGTYLAAVATSTQSIAGRFTLDARVWTRIDGTVVADGGTAMFDGTQRRSFINQNASGAIAATSPVFTGNANATTVAITSENCSDWSSISNGVFGTTASPLSVKPAEVWGGQSASCNAPQPILCLQQ